MVLMIAAGLATARLKQPSSNGLVQVYDLYFPPAWARVRPFAWEPALLDFGSPEPWRLVWDRAW